ncbi:MAG: hypothetical protein VX432_02880, partial [Candidatus Poribacteria bacterium]|nr:hypothetical protein [Candidatus Poribacteria bacterium]
DPVGRSDGDFKVTRGGSHSTEIYYLRSANRMGTLPEDKHWLIGFRVVTGELPKTQPLPVLEAKGWQHSVRQDRPPDINQLLMMGQAGKSKPWINVLLPWI